VLTAGLAGNPTDTNLPTSAVVNMAWAMGFNVSDAAQPPLSKGAAIGVGVGAGVFGLALIALTAFVCLRVRRNKKRALEGGGTGPAQPDMGQVATQGTTYQQGYHHAAPGSPPLSSLPPSSPPLSDAGGYPFQGQYAPVPGKGHSRGYSDVSEAGWSQGSSEYPPQGYRQEGYQVYQGNQGYQGTQTQMQYQPGVQHGDYRRSELSGGQ